MTESHPIVSVIIPAYNVTAYISEAIDSVLAQTFSDFEVIVINDACPDSQGLETVLERYGNRIRYIKHDGNRGLAATRNTGIEAANGEFIALLDADDIYEPNYLEVQVEKLRQHPEADVVYGDATLIGDDPCVGMPISKFKPSNGPVTFHSLLREEVSVAVMCLIRRSALSKFGLFDSRLRSCEDFDLWLRIANGGGLIIYHAEPIAKYRVRGNSLSRDPLNMFHHKNLVLEKVERELMLTDEERAVVAEARVRAEAEYHLQETRRLFAMGKFAGAAEHLRAANRHYDLWKYKIASALMTHAPSLVTLAVRGRDLAKRAAGRV